MFQVTPKIRAHLINNYLIPTIKYFNLCKDTLHLSVNIMDRYFEKEDVASQEVLVVLALACLRIASKKVKSVFNSYKLVHRAGPTFKK